MLLLEAVLYTLSYNMAIILYIRFYVGTRKTKKTEGYSYRTVRFGVATAPENFKSALSHEVL